VSERVLVDTGPLVAIFSARDSHHAKCVDQLRTLRAPLVTTWPVLTETAYLLRSSPHAVQELLRAVGEAAWLRVADLESDAPTWLSAFFDRFVDHEPQLADASLVYLAERLRITTVFTLDRRDFAIYRTADDHALTVVP
jgi:hypothetical protein